MGDVLLNGRVPQEQERAAVRRIRERELGQALELLAGVLTGEPVPLYAGRTLNDLPVLP